MLSLFEEMQANQGEGQAGMVWFLFTGGNIVFRVCVWGCSRHSLGLTSALLTQG